MKICIDPGHGGHDSGAVGPKGSHEKALVLEVGMTVRAKLEYLHEIKMTRENDVFHTLTRRAHISNAFVADFFLSIHANAGGGIGFEAFTTPGQTDADPQATKLLNSYHEAAPTRVFRKDLRDGDPDKEARFTVLTKTRAPAVLFELGFIDHQEEETWMWDNVELMAQALANPFLHVNLPTDPTPGLDPEITRLLLKVESSLLDAIDTLRTL
jgi:N-acetylmuramoyl-L-alanine amidase